MYSTFSLLTAIRGGWLEISSKAIKSYSK